ncbi:MAG: outer membrane beta-barrel protein [Gelidibacter sp.]
MKRFFTFFYCFISGFTLFGQQLFLEAGKSISSFDYKNSLGNSIENLQSKSNTYLNLGYRDHLNDDKTLFLVLGLTYSDYGAIGSDPILDNYYEWDVTYLGLQAGLDFRLFRIRDFSFFIKGRVTVEHLIRGTQTINNQVYDLVGEKEFNSNIFFLKGGLGMQYPISRNTSVFVNYFYGKTMLIDQSKSPDQETLKFNNHQLGIGLIINLPNCNCSF